MDKGGHELRLLVTAGDAADVRRRVTGLADWLSAPPAVYAHLPIGVPSETPRDAAIEWLRLAPAHIRLLACKRSWGGQALIVRMQETGGEATVAELHLPPTVPPQTIPFQPYEVKTLRRDRHGSWQEAHLIWEDAMERR